jgi:DNA-binding transcriptional ArsR family regulator
MQVRRRAAKDALFTAFAAVAKALGNGHRAEIVDVLAQGERSVDALASEIDESVANTSQHLQRLAAAGVVRSRREGARVLYRLSSDEVGELWSALRRVAGAHVAEIEVLAAAYMGDRGAVERVSAGELAARLADGTVVVLDVRPRVEFDAGHVAGARWASLDALDGLASELSGTEEVVAYCRGPYCVYADDAVRILAERGVRARRLDSGFPEWRRAGLPIATAASETGDA